MAGNWAHPVGSWKPLSLKAGKADKHGANPKYNMDGRRLTGLVDLAKKPWVEACQKENQFGNEEEFSNSENNLSVEQLT